MVHANKSFDEMDFLWECRPVDTDRLNGGDLARVEMNAHAILCALSMIERDSLSDTLLEVYAETKGNCIRVKRYCRNAKKGAVDYRTIAELYGHLKTLSVYLFGNVRPNIVTVLESTL